MLQHDYPPILEKVYVHDISVIIKKVSQWYFSIKVLQKLL